MTVKTETPASTTKRAPVKRATDPVKRHTSPKTGDAESKLGDDAPEDDTEDRDFLPPQESSPDEEEEDFIAMHNYDDGEETDDHVSGVEASPELSGVQAGPVTGDGDAKQARIVESSRNSDEEDEEGGPREVQVPLLPEVSSKDTDATTVTVVARATGHHEELVE